MEACRVVVLALALLTVVNGQASPFLFNDASAMAPSALLANDSALVPPKTPSGMEALAPMPAAGSAPSAPMLLRDVHQLFPGELTRVYNASYQTFQYFFFNVVDQVDITVSVIALTGDPDLYIVDPSDPEPFSNPRRAMRGWSSTNSGNDTIFISKKNNLWRMASYAVGVRGFSKENTTFQVQLTLTPTPRVLVPAQVAAAKTIFDACCTPVWAAQGGCQKWLEYGGMTGEFCELPGNICSEDGQLQVLDLSAAPLQCDFPFEALQAMPSLEEVTLAGNFLTGPIDWATLAALPNLQILNLASNMLSGNISCELAAPTHPLHHLYLSDNQLVGEFPACYLQKTGMRVVVVSQNSLTGTLPTSIPLNSELRVVQINQNSIGGSLVADYGKLAHIQTIDMSYNAITGEIPKGLIAPWLDQLSLHHNQLAGAIPDDLFQRSSASSILLNANFLTGSFPAALANNSVISEATLQENRLTGALPTLWSSVQLVSFSARANQLSGPIPLSLLTLPKLLVVNLQQNNFSGDLPDFPPGLVSQVLQFNVSQNQLTGLIPQSYARLPIFSNDTALVVQTQGQFVQLSQVFDVSNNKMVGPIPDWLAPSALPLSTAVRLSGNSFVCPFGSSPDAVFGDMSCGGGTTAPDGSAITGGGSPPNPMASSSAADSSTASGDLPQVLKQQRSDDGGLSGGAIAGIVIGVLGGVGILAALVAFVVIKARQGGGITFRRLNSTAGGSAVAV